MLSPTKAAVRASQAKPGVGRVVQGITPQHHRRARQRENAPRHSFLETSVKFIIGFVDGLFIIGLLDSLVDLLISLDWFKRLVGLPQPNPVSREEWLVTFRDWERRLKPTTVEPTLRNQRLGLAERPRYTGPHLTD